MDDAFKDITAEERQAAVSGFVHRNPHYDGIDFDTMIEILLDADAHMPIIGDVEITPITARQFVHGLASLGGASQ